MMAQAVAQKKNARQPRRLWAVPDEEEGQSRSWRHRADDLTLRPRPGGEWQRSVDRETEAESRVKYLTMAFNHEKMETARLAQRVEDLTRDCVALTSRYALLMRLVETMLPTVYPGQSIAEVLQAAQAVVALEGPEV